MTLSEDFRDLIGALSDARASFMLVGGYAVAIHGRPRGTKDLDLWVEPTLANAQRVLTALAEFGVPAGDLSAEELATPGTGYMMGRPPTRIDILTRISGVSFDNARANVVVVDVAPGCPCPVIGLEDLITNKRAAGRPQDLADAAALERLSTKGP